MGLHEVRGVGLGPSFALSAFEANFAKQVGILVGLRGSSGPALLPRSRKTSGADTLISGWRSLVDIDGGPE